MNAMFPFQTDILSLIIKGMIIGIAASAPMGPVGILCVHRTQRKGRWYGFVTGVGAAVSDLIYAMFTGFGMSFVMNFINNPVYKFYLQLGGGLMLLCFGLFSFCSNPLRNSHQSNSKGKGTGTLLHNGITAFLITFSNPLIILLFMALFAQFAFAPKGWLELCLGYMSIIGGALLWWYGLTWLIDKIKTKFDETGVVIINRIIGSVVIIFSIISLIGTVFNIYLFPKIMVK